MIALLNASKASSLISVMIIVGNPEAVSVSDILDEITFNIGIVNIGSIKQITIPFENKGNTTLFISDIYISDKDALDLFDFLNPDFPILIPENKEFNFQFVFRAVKAYTKSSVDVLLRVYYYNQDRKEEHKWIKLTFTFNIQTERLVYPFKITYRQKKLVKEGVIALKLRPVINMSYANQTVNVDDFSKKITNISVLVKDISSNEYKLMNSLITDNGELIYWIKFEDMIGKSLDTLEFIQLTDKNVIGKVVSCYLI